MFDQPFENSVKNRVRRKGVLIDLIRSQFGAGRLTDGAFRDDFTLLTHIVDEPGNPVDILLKDVAKHSKAATHITVKRAIANGEFAFVTRRKSHPAMPVASSHDDAAADSRLEILVS